jgi:hypothetical protein
MNGPKGEKPGGEKVGATPKAQALMDALSRGLLLLWAALALACLSVPAVGTTADTVIDATAWGAFGGAMLLTGLPRWLSGASDSEMIGPFRLWLAACAAALLFCMASSFIAAPRIKDTQAQIASGAHPAESVDALSKRLAKAKNFSVQFLCIRMALAVGLAIGAKKLPKAKLAGGGDGGRGGETARP